MYIVTGIEMRKIDSETIERFVPGITLMERAGQRIFDRLCEYFGPIESRKVSIFLGRGNNAGDGLVVARLLAEAGARVRLDYLHEPKDFSPDAFKNYVRLSNFRKNSEISENFLYLADWEEKVRLELEDSDFIIDGLLGTGISKPVKESYAKVIDVINSSGLPIVSVDVPSGVNGDTGEIMGTSVRADVTVTLGLPKIGLLFYPGKSVTGDVTVGDIGIPKEVIEEQELTLRLIDSEQARDDLPVKAPESHKFARGSLLVVAGSRRYAGAARLAAESALRTGCGIVYLAAPHSIRTVIQASAPEVIFISLPETDTGTIHRDAIQAILGEVRYDALAVGPGLTAEEQTTQLVRELVSKCEVPLLLDADGINAFEGRYDDLVRSIESREAVVSPHSGELKRLTGRDVVESPPAGRIEHLRDISTSGRFVLVHKSAPTIVAQPNGHLYVNVAGHPGMATAGSGDVLTGAIGGFLAQGSAASAAARIGVYLHSRAADLAALEKGEGGMIAGDCMRSLPEALSEIEGL
jgi:NAD(P)H-hydrate epimerase